MAYFSRLTDIVTCSLTEILSTEDDPPRALRAVISEMEEGLAGARRSVETALANERRIKTELDEHARQIESWSAKAKERLAGSDEDGARAALLRKGEVADLLAGLEQQHKAAIATREHLTTMLRAIEARLAEARRRQAELEAPSRPDQPEQLERQRPGETAAGRREREERVEAELDELRRELGR